MSSSPAELRELCERLIAAKAIEATANARRVEIENQIIAITGKRDEGSKTTEADGFKITVTGKVTRKMDWEKWEQVKGQIAPALHPVKTKLELDEKGVKWLHLNEPEIYALLPIEVKPAKTSVEVKEATK